MVGNNVERFSNCCSARPLGELDSSTSVREFIDCVVETTHWWGRCSKCKDNAEFFTMDELRAQDGITL